MSSDKFRALRELPNKYARMTPSQISEKRQRMKKRVVSRIEKDIEEDIEKEEKEKQKKQEERESAERRFARQAKILLDAAAAAALSDKSEQQQRQESVLRATTEFRQSKQIQATNYYKSVIDALNVGGILPPHMQATTAELSTDDNLIMINLVNTNNILPNLTGVHITFVINRPQANHITFNVPNGWYDSKLPPNAEDVRIGITRNTMNFNYRINEIKQQPLHINAPRNRLPQTIKKNIISPEPKLQQIYSILRLQQMFTTVGNILENIKTNIYSNDQLRKLLTTRPKQGGAKSRKSTHTIKRKRRRTRRLKNKRN